MRACELLLRILKAVAAAAGLREQRVVLEAKRSFWSRGFSGPISSQVAVSRGRWQARFASAEAHVLVGLCFCATEDAEAEDMQESPAYLLPPWHKTRRARNQEATGSSFVPTRLQTGCVSGPRDEREHTGASRRLVSFV